jgi:hypothetical protein
MGRMTSHILWKFMEHKKHVWNHQPVMISSLVTHLHFCRLGAIRKSSLYSGFWWDHHTRASLITTHFPGNGWFLHTTKQQIKWWWLGDGANDILYILWHCFTHINPNSGFEDSLPVEGPASITSFGAKVTGAGAGAESHTLGRSWFYRCIRTFALKMVILRYLPFLICHILY